MRERRGGRHSNTSMRGTLFTALRRHRVSQTELCGHPAPSTPVGPPSSSICSLPVSGPRLVILSICRTLSLILRLWGSVTSHPEVTAADVWRVAPTQDGVRKVNAACVLTTARPGHSRLSPPLGPPCFLRLNDIEGRPLAGITLRGLSVQGRESHTCLLSSQR